MFNIGGRPKNLQSFLSNIKSSMGRSNKGGSEGTTSRSSSDSLFKSRGEENPYLSLPARVPQARSAQGSASAHRGPEGDNFDPKAAGKSPEASSAKGSTSPNTGLSRRNAVQAPTVGVSLRGRGRSGSGASLKSVASQTPSMAGPRGSGLFTQNIVDQESPLDRLVRETKARATAQGDSPASSRTPSQASSGTPESSVHEDMWAHLG